MIPQQTIDTLTSVWRDVIDLCSDLTPEQWATPTDCPGWDVKDNVSHLIGTERLLEGLPATEHRADGGAHVKNPIGQFNENEIDVRRPHSGDEVLAEWRELVDLRTATLAAGDAAYFEQPMATPVGPGTMTTFLAVRILDCWGHEQDIRNALGRPGGLDTPAAGHTIDRLLGTLPIVVGKRARCPEGGAVRLNIVGPTARSVTVQVDGGRAGFVDAPAAAPLATIQLETDAFVALALGRRTAASVPVQIDGDQALGRAVVDQINMMI